MKRVILGLSLVALAGCGAKQASVSGLLPQTGIGQPC